MKVAVKDLAEVVFGARVPGYFDRVGKFFERLDIDTSSFGDDTVMFENAVDFLSAQADKTAWSLCVQELLNAAVAQAREMEQHQWGPVPRLAPLKQLVRALVQELAPHSIGVDSKGILVSTGKHLKFISECILCDCTAAPISRGDVQVNEVIARLSSLPEGATIVDIGAGKGRCLQELTTYGRFPTWHYIGLNIDQADQQALEEYIRKNGYQGNSVSLMMDGPPPRVVADAVLCVNVLHCLWFEQLPAFFASMSSLAKNDALVVVHDMAVPAEGERHFLSWDADMAADALSPWCSDVAGRDFETKGGLAVWTVSARKASEPSLKVEQLVKALSARKERLAAAIAGEKDASKRSILTELYYQLDRAIPKG